VEINSRVVVEEEEEKIMSYVAPNIAAALKINLELWKKNSFLASCSFRGKRSCLRSRYLVLWSLGTLTWSTDILWCGIGYVKGKILSPLKRFA
jgi:hypothetical protein